MTTYKVKTGDTLWSIAKKLLGDGNKYKEIQRANGLKDTVIHPNQVLKIPSSNHTGGKYEEIGKALEKAMDDVYKLPSVQTLYDMLGD